MLHAQGTKADYERANNMRQLVKGKVLGLTGNILWVKATDQVFYSNTTAEGKLFMLANWKKKKKGWRSIINP